VTHFRVFVRHSFDSSATDENFDFSCFHATNLSFEVEHFSCFSILSIWPHNVPFDHFLTSGCVFETLIRMGIRIHLVDRTRIAKNGAAGWKNNALELSPDRRQF